MFKNFVKITWRNLNKNRMSSFINIGGLALGMAVTILIGLWIQDELNFDKHHANYDKIGQLYEHSKFNGKVYTGNSMPMPIGEELRNRYGQHFKHVILASWEGSHILSFDDNHLTRSGIYMEEAGPEMLSLKMLGGTMGALSDPTAILLSASTATALFGDSDPINKSVKLNNKDLLKVAGVYEDLPYNTSFRNLKFIAPWKLYEVSEPWIVGAKTEWGNNSFQVFGQIADNTTFEEVIRGIADVKMRNVAEEDRIFDYKMFLHPMKEWHLRSSWEDGVLQNGQVQYVWMFGAIGVFVLLLACINFMNLSTARSEKRAKEVGIKKAVGAERRTLVLQFFYESLVVALIALFCSILLVAVALPWFNQVADKKIEFPASNPVFWLATLFFSVLTGLMAGSYPALYLSSFQPVKVLKGVFRAGKTGSVPRRVLVVVQFTVSIMLVVGTTIVYKQILYTKNRPVGYERDGLITLEMRSPDFYGKFDVLDSRLKQEGAIANMAESSSPMDAVYSNNDGFGWDGKDPNLKSNFGTIWVTHDYGKTIGWEMKEGRDFSKSFATDSSGIILNESAVKFMNLNGADPVGKVITWGRRSYNVLGVVKDVVMQSPFLPVRQVVYFLDYNNVNFINLKLNPERPAAGSIATIEKVFKEVIPAAPFDYKFADEAYAAKFEMEERVGKLAALFTVLAIVISCLGLFGLASFTAEQRIKEIGIRKIVGASVYSLWQLLTSDFLLLTGLASLIAMPVSYFVMEEWLKKYNYRTSITWEVFVVALVIALLITIATVSYQALKAAGSNPVKSLRSE